MLPNCAGPGFGSAFRRRLKAAGLKNWREPEVCLPSIVSIELRNANSAPDEFVPFEDVSVFYEWHAGAKPGAAFEDVLTEADFAEFAHVKHATTRARSLATRARLRSELSKAVDGRVEASEWVFERDERGKPCLGPAPVGLHFSCSHTPWVSVVAVSKRHPVGIDVESTALTFDDPSLIEDFFAPGELQSLDCLALSDRAGARARLWTLKEAVVKMLGTGLALDLSKLEFETQRDRLRSSRIPEIDVSGMRLASWHIPSKAQRLSLALAVKH